MEKFFHPLNRKTFVRWLLEESAKNDWTIVLEYPGDEGYNILRKNATIITLPLSAIHNYDGTYKLTAVTNLKISDKLVNKLIHFSVLSIHDKAQMIFLIADYFHKDCFSCSSHFYDHYNQIIKSKNLISTNL